MTCSCGRFFDSSDPPACPKVEMLLRSALGAPLSRASRAFFATNAPRLKRYRLNAVGKGSACEASFPGPAAHRVSTDLPAETGGNDNAPEPVLVMLAALAGCETATARFVARHLKLKVVEMRFELEAERDQRGALSMPIDVIPAVPARLTRVSGRVRVVAPGATAAQLDVLAAQTHARCPIANLLVAAGTQLDVHYELDTGERDL